MSTVLYLPNLGNLQIEFPFRAFSLSGNINGDATTPELLTIVPSEYDLNYTISSLNAVLDGMKEQKVCVYYDKSTDKENWKLFWNQDKVLDDLKAVVKPQITDATVCESRDIQSS
jgi:hypothetical protein